MGHLLQDLCFLPLQRTRWRQVSYKFAERCRRLRSLDIGLQPRRSPKALSFLWHEARSEYDATVERGRSRRVQPLWRPAVACEVIVLQGFQSPSNASGLPGVVKPTSDHQKGTHQNKDNATGHETNPSEGHDPFLVVFIHHQALSKLCLEGLEDKCQSAYDDPYADDHCQSSAERLAQ
jgi:hypothetical protein